VQVPPEAVKALSGLGVRAIGITESGAAVDRVDGLSTLLDLGATVDTSAFATVEAALAAALAAHGVAPESWAHVASDAVGVRACAALGGRALYLSPTGADECDVTDLLPPGAAGSVLNAPGVKRRTAGAGDGPKVQVVDARRAARTAARVAKDAEAALVEETQAACRGASAVLSGWDDLPAELGRSWGASQ
jgi:hypothetical protein